MLNNILVLAIGNDIMGDDGAALAAAEILQKNVPDTIDFEYVYGGGLEILDYMEGREKTLILDTISTGLNPPGTIIEFKKDDFQYITASSPHYVGLPEVVKMATLFGIDFPNEIKILAIEIVTQHVITEEISPNIGEHLPFFIKKAKEIIDGWLKDL